MRHEGQGGMCEILRSGWRRAIARNKGAKSINNLKYKGEKEFKLGKLLGIKVRKHPERDRWECVRNIKE